jgi:hypothetical protein
MIGRMGLMGGRGDVRRGSFSVRMMLLVSTTYYHDVTDERCKGAMDEI